MRESRPSTPNVRAVADRTVTCPTCAGPSLFTPANRFRPFCSERCKQVDLGAWASEAFRVPDTSPGQDAEGSTH